MPHSREGKLPRLYSNARIVTAWIVKDLLCPPVHIQARQMFSFCSHSINHVRLLQKYVLNTK